jgi:hypothetical protein
MRKQHAHVERVGSHGVWPGATRIALLDLLAHRSVCLRVLAGWTIGAILLSGAWVVSYAWLPKHAFGISSSVARTPSIVWAVW